jgi:hypothetical protein
MTEQPSSEVQILRAVQALDSKLTDALNRQTRTLTASIQALADRHTESLLQQEKRNATFADRDRVESVAEHTHTIANLTQSLILRVTAAETRAVELASDIQACRQSISQQAVGFLTGANGYLVTFIVMMVVAVVAAVIARLIR